MKRHHVPMAALCLIALLISPLFSHSDLNVILWLSVFVGEDFNVYRSVATYSPAALETIGYGPVIYWLFWSWIELGRALFDLFPLASWNEPKHLSAADYLWAKAIYLPFFSLWCWASIKMLRQVLPGFKADNALHWFLLSQPIPIFISFVMGQFDIIPASLAVWGGYLVLGQRFLLAGFIFALATLTKNWPGLLFVGWALITLLLHPDKKQRLQMFYGVLGFAATLAATLSSVWGEPLLRSYLAFNNQGYIYRQLDLPWIKTNIYLYLLVIATVAGLLSNQFRRIISNLICRLPLLMRDGVMDLPTWQRLIFWSSLTFFGLLFFNRVWMPQYFVWVLPWLVIFALYSAYHQERSMLKMLAVIQLLYLFIVPVYWVGMVDSSMYLFQSNQTTWGQTLALLINSPRPAIVWMIFSALFIYLIGRSVAECYQLLMARQSESIKTEEPRLPPQHLVSPKVTLYQLLLLGILMIVFIGSAYSG